MGYMGKDMDAVNATFWGQNPNKVAKEILGKTLRLGTVNAVILGTQGFSRAENSSGIYLPILDMAPGTVFCPRTRNSILFLIATHDRGTRGGCVLVRTIESRGALCEGPGRVTQCLGVTEPRVTGKAWVDVNDVITIFGIHPLYHPLPNSLPTSDKNAGHNAEPIRHASGNGKKMVKKYLHKIVRVYMKKKQHEGFEAFLSRASQCASEEELRAFLEEQ